jgi:hypothetical protein
MRDAVGMMALFMVQKEKMESKALRKLNAFDVSFLAEMFTGIPKEKILEDYFNLMTEGDK